MSDQMEQQLATNLREGQVADLINDQQLGPAQKAQTFAQGALPLRLGERTDDVGQGGEVDRTAGFDRLDTKGQRQVGFAAAGLTEKMDRLVTIDEVELGQRQPTLVQRLADPANRWRRVTLSQWYGEGKREL